MKCRHYTAGMCGDLSREAGATWCCARWDCQTKNDLRPAHLLNLGAYARSGDQYGVRAYLAHVETNEGTPSADVLLYVFRSQEAPSGS